MAYFEGRTLSAAVCSRVEIIRCAQERVQCPLSATKGHRGESRGGLHGSEAPPMQVKLQSEPSCTRVQGASVPVLGSW